MSRKFLDDTFAVMFSNPDYSKYLFYAHILGQCNVKIADDLPAPAGVSFNNGHFNLYINPESFSSFPVSERIGVLKHEALHIINGHLGERNKGLNQKIANLAMDCSINQMIDRVHLPRGVIYPDVLEEMLKEYNPNIVVPEEREFEFYYALIRDNMPKEAMENDDGEGENQGDSGQGGSDQQNTDSNGADSPAKKGKKPGKFTEIDSHANFNEGQAVNEEFLKERTRNLLEKAKDRTLASNGSLPRNFSDMIELNSPKKSEVPWQKMLQQVASNTKVSSRETFMRKSRRFRNRPDVKGRLPNRTFDLLTIVDVSGSMPQESVKDCLNEMKFLCKKMDITARLIQVDTEPLPSIEIDARLKTFERKAMGGTIMYPGIEQANKEKLHYDAVVILTDGGLAKTDIEAFLDVKVPVIWIVTDDYNIELDNFRKGKMKAARLKVME